MKPKFNRCLGAFAFTVTALSSSAFAARLYKDVTTTDLNTVANWATTSGGVTDPGSIGTTDALRFNEIFAPTSGTNYTVSLSANLAVGGIQLDSGSANGGTATGNVVISAGNTLTLNGASSTDINYAAGGIVLNSATGGTLTINAGINIGGSQQWVTSRALTVGGDINLNANTLSFNTAGSSVQTLSGVISGTGSLNKTAGTGTLALSNTANSFSGTVTLVGGTTTITKLADGNSNSSLGSGTSAIVLNGAVLTYNGTTTDTTNRAIDLRASSTINNNGTGGVISFTAASVTQGGTASARLLTLGGSNANANTFGSILGDSGTGANITSLTKSGGGTWVVSGANGYTGLTTVSAGVLNIQNNTATGTTAGGVSVTSGAALQIQNGITVGAEALALNGTGISTTGALRNISGANVWQGTVTLGSAARINSDSGTLTFDTAANSITGTNQNLTLGGANGGTVAGTITTGTGTLTKDGAGTWVLNGANNYTGSTVINQGVLRVTGGGVLGGATGSTGDANNIWFTSTSANGTIEFETSANLGAADQLRFRNTGGTAGTGGNLKYIGTTAQVVSKAIQCDTSIGVRLSSDSVGGSVEFSGTWTNASGRAVYLGGTGIGDNKVSGAIGNSSTGTLTKVDTGTWILSGTNTYTGATTVSAGTLKAGATSVAGVSGAFGKNSAMILANAASTNIDLNGFDTQIGSLTGGGVLGGNVILGSKTLTIGGDNSSPAAYAGVISGTGGGIAKNGTGTLILSGTNTYTGNTTMSAGALSVAATGNLGDSASNLVFDGGTLQITGTTLTNLSGIGHAVSFTATKTVGLDINNAANTFTVDQVLNQTTGGFTKLGAGTAILDQANTYTGLTTISAGTLSFTGTSNLGTSGGVSLGGGLLSVGATGTLTTGAISNSSTNSGLLTIASGGVLNATSYITSYSPATFNIDGTLNLSGVMTFSINASKTVGGAGTINAAGYANNNFTNITFGGQRLNLGASGIANSVSQAGSITLNGTTVGASADWSSSAALILTGADKVDTLDSVDGNTARTITLSGALSSTGGLTKSGAGTLTLSGTNSYVGGTTINGGTLQLGNGGATGSLSATGAITNNANLKINRSNAVAQGTDFSSAAITGTGSLTAAGAGTITLNAANSYSGGTTVNAGADLRINGVQTGVGTVDVAATGKLGGSGSVIGGINVSGVLAPGNSIESLGGGALSFATASTYAYELQTDLYAGTPGVAGDLTYSSGTLTIASGTILTLTDLAATSTTLLAGSKLTLISSVGVWNGGLFSYDAGAGLTPLADDSKFTLGLNEWQFNYNDTTGGFNYTGDQTGATSFVTMTVVPEPNVAALIGGFGMLALLRRRRS